ncbi:hypothetical protein CDAR_199522 [Caerostris darwini]|uniref:GON-4-like protein n=1 Tax=Caerostris darwini TaxID=1538125 RepID=A0AAV4M9A8_9ARAC|nr:hypothetical protein CDAR_199522 [Caerostris darwini]
MSTRNDPTSLNNTFETSNTIKIEPEITVKSKKRKNTDKLPVKRKKINCTKSRHTDAESNAQIYFEGACPKETVETVLEDMEEEIDNALEKAHYKNKLTPSNVKNILRYIIANEYVLAMVSNTMKLDHSDGEELGNQTYEPKLTRSKAKEMRKKQCTLPWPVSSLVKKVEKASQKLLHGELSEENSSDEDYKPNEEESPSDDDDPVISSPKACDSEQILERKSSSPVSLSTSEVENIPSIELPEINMLLNTSEVDKIALRTRSKLCLNDTPLEDIEASFIAPDITIDMYDTNCDDEEWQDFLRELYSQVSLEHTDDVEEDPEYKIREDDDVPDYNDLRYDNSVKITRDELNALLAEILEFAHQELGYLDDEDDEENKIISENSAPPVTNVGLVSVENVQSQWMTSDERLQLDEQMRMYIQILTQSYLLSHGNSQLNFINISSKLFLDEMKMFASREMATNERSAFYAQNLDGALEIVNEYENHRMLLRQTNLLPLKKTVLPSVPQHVKKTLATSKVFIYPDLLPVCGFYDFHEKQKTKFSVHEDNLIALGMEQFADVKNPVDYIHTLLVPAKTKEQIKIRIKNSKVKKNSLDNPIKFYHVYKQAPVFQRTVRIFDPYNIKAPEDYPSEILPKWMESYSKVGIHAHVQPLIAPSQPKENAKTPVAIVRPMFRKPLEARKLNPILPRGFSPLKQISPILKKYSQQRRLVPVLSLNGISPNKKRLPPKQYAKPILKPALAIIFPKPDGLKDGAKKELLSLKKTVTFNASPSVLSSLSLSQAVSIPSIPETQIMKQTSSKSFIASTPLRTQPDTETLDEIDEDIIEEDHDLISTATPANNTNGKKQAVSKKRNKLQRDLEASLALLQPTLMKDDPKKEDREVLFANSYLLRASEILKGSPEIYEKFLSVLCKYHQSTRPPVELYLEIKETLKDYPALVRDFIIFLKPEQAKECGKYKELVALNKIREFFRKVEMHFKNQPQHITRILRILAQLHHQVDITSAEVITALQPMLRNQSHLMEELYNLLPDANPPEYLMTDFESVDIPNSDEDNSSVDSCEDIIIPDTPDLYGGKECPCDCHTSSTDNKMLNRSRHCIKCGVKFIDGRIYIQTGKVLKPAQVTYHDLPRSSAGKKKTKNQPVSSKVQRPSEVPSKTTPNAQVKNTAAAPSIGVNGKVDNMTTQKDVPKFTNDAHVFSQDEAPLLSSNKLPCDVIEDTIFPVSISTLNKSTPSDFSHLKDIIAPTAFKKSGNSGAELTQKIKWTRDDDKLIIYNCQRYGISRKAFSTSAAAFQNRTIEQVQARLLNLMEILSEEMKRH